MLYNVISTFRRSKKPFVLNSKNSTSEPNKYTFPCLNISIISFFPFTFKALNYSLVIHRLTSASPGQICRILTCRRFHFVMFFLGKHLWLLDYFSIRKQTLPLACQCHKILHVLLLPWDSGRALELRTLLCAFLSLDRNTKQTVVSFGSVWYS